jgi:hypothetical protein
MENKYIKNNKDLECFLDLYSQELYNIKSEALSLYTEIHSKPKSYWDENKSQFNLAMKKIKNIESNNQSLEECQRDCVHSL